MEAVGIDWIQTAIICSISLGSGFIVGLTGFGAAIFFQMIWMFLDGELRTARAVLTFIVFVAMLPLTFIKESRDNCIWRIVLGLVPGNAISILLGTWLLVTIESDIARMVLGFSFYFVCICQFIFLTSTHRAEPKKSSKSDGQTASHINIDDVEVLSHGSGQQLLLPNPVLSINSDPITNPSKTQRCISFVSHVYFWGAFITGCASGVLQGMFSTGGAVLIIFFSMTTKLDKQEIRATKVTETFMMGFVLLFSGIYFQIFRMEEIPAYLFSPICALFGSWVGHRLFGMVNTFFFRLVLMMLLFVSAFSLTGGFRADTFGMAIKITSGSLLMGAFLLLAKRWYDKRKQAAQAAENTSHRPRLRSK